MSNPTPSESAGYPSFISMLIYLSMYFVVELFIKKTFKLRYPEIYLQLYHNRKDVQYFAFVMGILITVFSTPFCITAFIQSDQGGPFDFSEMTTAGRVCIATRSVLWVSELNRLDHATVYIAHHLSSLGFLVWHLYNRLPLQIMYGFYSSLATEFFSDIRCLLEIHGVKSATSALAYRLQVIIAILLVVLRIPPIIYAATFFPYWSITGHVFWINAACLLFYTWFIVNLLNGGMRKLEMFKWVPGKPAYVRVCQSYNVSVYGIFFAIASFSAAMITSTIYLSFNLAHDKSKDMFYLTSQILLTGLAGLIGARLPSILASHGASSVISTKFFNKTSLWLQGSLAAMSLSIVLSPLVCRPIFFLALATSLPLSEAIGRLGCHFAGCCGYNDNRALKLSMQVKSSCLNAAHGAMTLSYLVMGLLTLKQAAGLSLACNALIRLMLRPNTFAVFQFIGSSGLLSFGKNGEDSLHARFISMAHGGQVLWNKTELPSIASACVVAIAAIAAGVFVQLCGGRMEVHSKREENGVSREGGMESIEQAEAE